jgi:hypothetical protein
MSYRYGTSLQPGVYTYGRGGLGIPAELVPSEGLDAPAYFYPALSLPADNGKEITARISRYPVNGTLTLYDDEGRWSYAGATDYLLYELRVDDVLSGVDIGYGPGVGRVDLVVGDSGTLSGDAALDAAVAGGAMGTAGASGLSGSVTLDAAAAAGSMVGTVVSQLGGDIALGNATAAGAIVGEGALPTTRHQVQMPDITKLRRRVAVHAL